MKVNLIAVGSELLRPGRRERHSDYLTSRLEGIGLEVGSLRVVPDSVPAIASALAEARRGTGLVLVTGGIGPTRDDRTREALARALGCPLRRDPASGRAVRIWCRRHRLGYTPDQERQSFLPEGARPVPNRAGSAPGIWYADGQGIILVLPGVFGEMKAMFDALAPRLRRLAGTPVATVTLRTAGRGESWVDHRLADIARSFAQVEVTTLASPGEVILLLRARGRGASRRVARCRDAMARRLGRDLVSETGETLEAVVLQLLRRRGLRLSVAESCTAGLVSARLTSVAGSSRVFLAGAVCYNDRAKSRILSISPEILRRKGGVSRDAAVAMAKGMANLTGSPVAVSVTGIAGPGGGTQDKPVGTVHWAVLSPSGVRTLARRLPGDRETIRRHAAAVALDLVRRVIRFD